MHGCQCLSKCRALAELLSFLIEAWSFVCQMAGYQVDYQGLRYVTILGAGHFTPAMKPTESLYIFERFLSDQKL